MEIWLCVFELAIVWNHLGCVANISVGKLGRHWFRLEQLERLCSEDTPRRPVITHTIDQFVLNPKSILLTSSYRIPSQKKVKAEKISEKFKFYNFVINLTRNTPSNGSDYLWQIWK